MVTQAIEFILNDRPIKVTDRSPNLTLLEFLRQTGRLGAKEGCAEGDCGACSVAILDRDSHGRRCYRSINSCLVPLCLLAGREVVSVEGVAQPGRLHPVQQAMADCHGSQCGYCTPGFILALLEGYYRPDLRTVDQLDDQLCGNLCRCTGYRSIREAASEAFSRRTPKNGHDHFAEKLLAPASPIEAARYEFAGETFFRPGSLDELLQLRNRHPSARLIAGATELGLDITKRYRKFPTLISLEAVPELRRIQSTAGEWRIGAAATLTEIEEQMGGEFPALRQMLRWFGSRQIRNRATMGGNVVTASPIGDSAPLLLALDATLVVINGQGLERVLPIAEFFVGYRQTAMLPGEILKTIVVPRASISRPGIQPCRFYKVSRRREMDISTVAAAFQLEFDGERIRCARLAFGGVAATPLRARQAEQALVGAAWNANTVERVLPILETEFSPISDVRGSDEYRRGLIGNLLEKFYRESVAGEMPGGDAESGREILKAPLKRLRRPLRHESAHNHVTGAALYTDDEAETARLEVWPVTSPHARARILRRDASAARTMPGIRAVLLAEDVPGLNDAGTKHDEILLPDREISYHGQVVALVVGETVEACRAAAEKVAVQYEPQPPIVTLRQAIEAKSFHNEPNYIRRGDLFAALDAAPLRLEGSFELGGQEHFYLETQAAWARPGEDDSIVVTSSTQHPSEVQAVVAHVLNLPAHKVVVQCPRLGGGFGGKETQAALPAALAALAARHTRQAVRVRFNRDQDMIISGHRHPFLARFQVGFDEAGLFRAARIELYSNGGWALDLSAAVTDRALFHLDNAYFIPVVEFRGQVAKTHLSSNTAFRGFGGPQGMLVIEEIIDRVARRLGLPPETVRERNLYRGRGVTNTTHYGQEVGDNRIQTIWKTLKQSSELTKRRRQIAQWNSKQADRKRGLAMTPVKFGISFTVTHLNQAGALVLIYQDGSVQVNHGGTEMGQGVHTNIIAIAAAALGIDPRHIRIMPTSTDKVPNTSATAASCGTDLNGAAVQNACEILRDRLAPVASSLLKKKTGRRPSLARLRFEADAVFEPGRPQHKVSFVDVVRSAYGQRVSLSATGYYRTPDIHWDRVAGRGKPFHYFACGAAVTEVEVDRFSGMHRVLRVDILHDAGNSINEGINRGQIEGGFVQGMGWLTTEELKWDSEGRLLTHSPDTYKIPAIGDVPAAMRVALLKNAAQKDVVHGSKAVGEPPLMLAISVREAIRDAIAAFGSSNQEEVHLASPATCEAIFMAIQSRRPTTSPPPGRDAVREKPKAKPLRL